MRLTRADDEPEPSSAAGPRSVQRAIAVLSAFTHREPVLTLSELAERCGLDPTTTLRYTRALVDARLLERRADMSFTLGAKVVELSGVYISQLDVRDYALPTMKRIRDELDETVLLSVRSGNYRVVIEQVEGFKEFRRTGGIGQHIPLHLGGPSLVLLASRPDKEIEAYADWLATDPPNIDPRPSRAELAETIATVRTQGFAETLNQRFIGGAGVAAPILDRNGETIAALNVAALLPVWPRIGLRARKLVIDGAAEISQALGHTPSQE